MDKNFPRWQPVQQPIPKIDPAILMDSHPAKMRQIAEANLASEFYSRLAEWISNFDASLDPEYEVGVRLVNFGQTLVFHLAGMGYSNPSLITFNGVTDNGEPVELIQHVSQLSVLLMKLPRREPEKPKQPIGFKLSETDT